MSLRILVAAVPTVALIVALLSCVSPPRGVRPVAGFNPERYPGVWYEIARLDHPFERGLTDVTAEYTLQPDGRLWIQNRGYDPKEGRWKMAEGVGIPLGAENIGSFKVKVGAPFYAGYHIIALDERKYRWAMVSGPSRRYLWILARKPDLAPVILTELERKAGAMGFPVNGLIRVQHGVAPGA